MQNLPDKLYTVKSVVQLEKIAINQYGIPAYELMKRAGNAVFDIISERYSKSKKILVLCGAGNNAGDGYVIARLAKKSGFDVCVCSLINPVSLNNEAILAYNDWVRIADPLDSVTIFDSSILHDVDLVVDALLGTGLTRDVLGEWAHCINVINNTAIAVISVDIPSGLLADTGVISGIAINADITVCFIGLKQGLFTAQAKDVCGEIIFDDLSLPDQVYADIACNAQLLRDINNRLLEKRKASSHKGCFGHVLIAGGNIGMPGAVILAARAALRTGAGLVTIVTVPQHLDAVISAVPEAMIRVCTLETLDDVFDNNFTSNITHLAVGMGLAQDDWSQALLKKCVQINKPMLLDADALNLIAKYGINDLGFSTTSPVVITPHPGEAARLLSINEENDTADVQGNRFKAIKDLHALFNNMASSTVVLKGSGTLIFDGSMVKVCQKGGAAMAIAGMGDVLSGIIIALWAQNSEVIDVKPCEIVELAVCLHATVADAESKGKTRGLLASDVIDALPDFIQ